jgi:hypothetical protein
MARGKKSGPSRIDLRRQAEAAESREKDEEEIEEEEEADEDAGDDDGGDDEDAPKKKAKPKAKKKKEPAKPKAKAPSKRSRTPKEVRMRAVWVVFDNASKRIDTFPYPQKAEAEKLLEQKREEKKTTFYMQLVKEPMES